MIEKALSYLEHKAKSDISQAEMSLDLLLHKSVGIGDHSTGDFTKNLDEALDLLVDANDRLNMINKLLEKYTI